MKYTITCHDKPGSKTRYRHALKLLGAESVRITETVEQEHDAPKPKPDNIPTSAAAKAVADLYGRKHETPWSDIEIKAFRDAVKRGILTIENMTIIANHYRIERKKPEHYCRRDVLTFLRHIDGEADRAKAVKPSAGKALEWAPANVVPMPEMSDEARLAGVAELRRTREQLRGGNGA